MKLNKIYSMLVLAGMFVFASCDVLDQEPEQQISDSGAFTNEKSADAAIAGLYHQLQSGSYYGRGFQHISEVSSDISQSVGTWDFYREMDTYQLDASNLELTNFYTAAYRAVNQANNLISSLPGIDMPAAKRDNYLGQAYFVRALAFFDLNRVFGGVPGVVGTNSVVLPLEPSRGVNESLFPSRPALAAGYAQVKSDLQQALTLLPETQASNAFTRSRAVKASARALLSRVHVYLREWDDAATVSSSVINDSKYSLVADYRQIFSGTFTNESIFELAFNNADQSGLRFWYFPGAQGGRGELAIHEQFVARMNANTADIRGTMKGFDNIQGVWYPTKYQKAGNIDHAHIIRIAEMYLNRAEANTNRNQLTQAKADLDAVRNRAGIGPYTGPLTQAALLLAIEDERALEFAWEGFRWFDLVRTNRAMTVLSSVQRKNSAAPVRLDQPWKQVLPIPRDELLSNKNMTQNQGYGN